MRSDVLGFCKSLQTIVSVFSRNGEAKSGGVDTMVDYVGTSIQSCVLISNFQVLDLAQSFDHAEVHIVEMRTSCSPLYVIVHTKSGLFSVG